MSCEVIVYLGPARSGKTHALVRQYRETLVSSPAQPIGQPLWLAPTSRAAAVVREQLVADGLVASLSPGILTFDDLTERILTSASSRKRPTTPAMEREIARRTIASSTNTGALTFYAKAARRSAFVDLLLTHIRELQRRGITPEKFARLRKKSGTPNQHSELASLYAAYQQLLDAARLIDSQGAPWAACDSLESGAASSFRRLKLVVVDGFTDFTAAQHKMLSLLAGRAERLLVSLPADALPASQASAHRPELFAKTAATLKELRRHHPKLTERRFESRPTSWPALDHLTRHIFRHPTPPLPDDVLASLDRFEIIEAAGAHDEIVQIARRIKRLLVSLPTREGQGEGSFDAAKDHRPASPGDIVVVFRSLGESAPRIREVFPQFGIPFSVETGPRLVSTALVKTLLAVLRLAEEDWPFRRTVSVLTNKMLTRIDEPSRRAADWLVRDLQVAQGRHSLLERVAQLAGDPTPQDQLSDPARRRTEAAQSGLPALQLLADAFDRLPREATPSEWCVALEQFGAELGLAPFSDRPAAARATGHLNDESINIPLQHGDATDLVAWQCIVEHFAYLELLDSWLDQPPRVLTRGELIAALVDVATHQPLPGRHDEVGRVRVLSAPTARNVIARHLFLAGLSEQSFPSPERAGSLCSEADYRFFARAADQRARESEAPNPPVSHRTHEEMLLFYEVISRAQESLTISYAALDDKAQQLPPSPYVIEIERVLRSAENQPRIRTAVPQLSPIPQGDRPFSVADWRIQAVAKAIHQDGTLGLIAGIFGCDAVQALARAIDAGLRIVHDRAHGKSFGPAEGLLTSPAAKARFTERFGPQHLWSPSQWETYAACPYKFWLENVLRLEPLGDLVLETDFTRRGSRLHRVLAAFHRQWPEVRGDAPRSADAEREMFLAHVRKVMDARIAATPRAGIDAALLELDCRQILHWAESHFEHQTRYDSQWSKLGIPLAPTHFELRFGPSRPGDADADDPDSRDQAFTLKIGGESIRVTGQIDRIDVGQIGNQVVFSVIDYKSGRKPSLKPEHIASGEHLQLPIYVEAAQAILFGGNAQPLAAGYWSMATGFDSKGCLAQQKGADDIERWTKTSEEVKQLVGRFIAAIRGGEFPVASRDEKCTSHCDFNTICRISQIRSLGKVWPPEVVESREPTVKSRKVEGQESRVESQKTPGR